MKTKKKLRVGILFGGKSAEHEVSLLSARNVVQAIDKDKFDLVLIGIEKSGRWQLNDINEYLVNPDDPKKVRLIHTTDEVTLVPGDREKQFINIEKNQYLRPLDVIFPVLHGPLGEDGTVQGLLKLVDIPFVGAGVLGSAIAMDKDVTKRLLREAGLPIAKFMVFNKTKLDDIDYDEIEEKLGYPCFVKPANMGSSVGISKVKSSEELKAAIRAAAQFDEKILVEEYIRGREIECSVLGNEEPQASLPGEILPSHEYYSYVAKYIDDHGARLDAPAKLSTDFINRVKNLAIEAYHVLCCQGMARVDFFLKENGTLIINEINTIPGFTKISMYPKLWEITGLKYKDLITVLIDLAIRRHEKEKLLKSSYD
ncbi:D-alanine--D-alanine ligase [candidate division KSB1 bacterium]|nr:D-alanine--D-alanine ligase [candidate division KSB1 bacterium]